jgi:hypothetical protein
MTVVLFTSPPRPSTIAGRTFRTGINPNPSLASARLTHYTITLLSLNLAYSNYEVHLPSCEVKT